MLLSTSEKLQYVALNAIIALTDEDEHYQNKLYNENILTPLIRLLKQFQRLSHRVLLVLVRAFGVLCTGTVNKEDLLDKFCLCVGRSGVGAEYVTAKRCGGRGCHGDNYFHRRSNRIHRCQSKREHQENQSIRLPSRLNAV